MKRIFTIIALALLFALPAFSQQPAPEAARQRQQKPTSATVAASPPASAPQLNEQQQKLIADAVAQGERARTEMRATALRVESLQSDAVPFVTKLQATLELMEVKARDETAQAKIAANIYFVMAQLGASPDMFEVRPAQQGGYSVVRKDSSPKK